jgi:hypothetical protein
VRDRAEPSLLMRSNDGSAKIVRQSGTRSA